MYVIQCTKSGVCDFYFSGSTCFGASFRKNQYVTSNGEATRSLNQAAVLNTKKAVRYFMDDVNYDLIEDDEPIPKFKAVPVALSLK